MTKHTRLCSMDGCSRKHAAKGFCHRHYNLEVAGESRHKSITRNCDVCGSAYTTKRTNGRYCSYECRSKDRDNYATRTVQCVVCGDGFLTTGARSKFCSKECGAPAPKPKHRMPRKDMRTPLRIAYEDGHGAAAIHSLIKRECLVAASGCWEWQGRVDNKGYPFRNIAGKHVFIHRMSLEAAIGKPLGSQPAHHICANAICVNPAHLQPVSQRDNVAEMLARTWMIRRIEELEGALSGISPDHPLLQEVSLQGVSRTSPKG